MNKLKIGLATIAMIFVSSASFSKDKSVRDVVGTWKGVTHAIIAGEGGHHNKSKGSFENPAFAERPFTFEVKGQDGRRFWGKIWMDDAPQSAEPFVASLGMDGRNYLLADTDGYMVGEFVGKNRMNFCYANTPGPKNPAAIVSCSEMKRVKQ